MLSFFQQALLKDAYNPKPYSSRVLLFKSMNRSILYKVNPPEPGWRKYVHGELEIHEVPGGHLSILEEPHVQVLAKKLKVCLDKAFIETKA